MQVNPAEDWQRLTEHYREVSDEELEELADDYGDLTETAQQALRSEMLIRGLGDPLAPAKPGSLAHPGPARWASSVDPDSGGERPDAANADGDNGPHDYTWKTLLCECEEQRQALEICEVLKRAEIESWIEKPGSQYSGDDGSWRVLVPADRLERAVEIARNPIPQDIVDLFREDAPAFEPPVCPNCGAEDPVLESADPVNAWLCEACGKQWTDPAPGPN